MNEAQRPIASRLKQLPQAIVHLAKYPLEGLRRVLAKQASLKTVGAIVQGKPNAAEAQPVLCVVSDICPDLRGFCTQHDMSSS